jgi:uncharacterized peroxidase-related enzyme
MSFLATVGEAEATGATADMYARERARVGRLPGYARAFGVRPGVYDAWRLLVGELTAGMPLRRFEIVTVVAARELRSTYCTVAHGTILTRFLPADDVAKLARGEVPNALDEQERAVVRFAAKAAGSAADITADDVDELRHQGLDDGEILDVVLTTAARCFFSTVLDATGTLADAGSTQGMSGGLRAALTVGRPPGTA